MSVGERLKEERRRLNMSQTELARRSGLTQPTISSLESGNSSTSGSIASLAAALGISALWLESGRGEKEPENLGANVYSVGTDPGGEGQFPIRLLQSKGSCGNGTHSYEELVKEPLIKEERWFKKHNVRPADAVAIYADGDSMANFIVDGDIIIFDTSITELKPGHIYVINTPDGLRVKRIHRRADGSIVLSSDNPDKTRFPDETYDPDSAANLEVKGKFIYRQGGA